MHSATKLVARNWTPWRYLAACSNNLCQLIGTASFPAKTQRLLTLVPSSCGKGYWCWYHQAVSAISPAKASIITSDILTMRRTIAA